MGCDAGAGDEEGMGDGYGEFVGEGVLEKADLEGVGGFEGGGWGGSVDVLGVSFSFFLVFRHMTLVGGILLNFFLVAQFVWF